MSGTLSKVTMQFPMFEALVRGYLTSAGSFLTNAEKQYLVFSGKLITFETGIRFLADYLAGATPTTRCTVTDKTLTAAGHNSNWLSPSSNRKIEWTD